MQSDSILFDFFKLSQLCPPSASYFYLPSLSSISIFYLTLNFLISNSSFYHISSNPILYYVLQFTHTQHKTLPHPTSSHSPPHTTDTYDSSDEAVLTAGCSITLPVDTAIRSHNLLVRVGPYDWSAVPLHTDEDKKSTIDFYQRSCSRTSGGGGGVETESALPRSIKLSLRSHSTSHPIDTDAVPLSPSFMMGPTVVVKVVTDVVLFSEGAFVDRSGLRLKLRASRRGVNVERHAWKEAVKGVDEEETSGYYKQDAEMTQGQRQGERQGGGEDVTDMPSPALEEPYLSFAIAGRLLHRTLCTDSRNSVELQSNLTSDTGLNDTSRSTRDKAEHTNFSGKQGSFSTSDINISPPHTAPLSLLNFAVRSCREYRVVDRLVEGQRVYTDRPNLTWIHLPSVLRYRNVSSFSMS